MKLYEVNTEIQDLLMQLEFDPETGEILNSSDEIIQRLSELEMEHDQILEYLAKVVIETRAEAAAIKAEEERLAARRKTFERKEERLMQVLDRECEGVNTDLKVATLRYRQTTRVEVQNTETATNWLLANAHLDCIRVKDPEVDKTAVKRLLTGGTEIPGVALVNSRTCSLK